MTAELNNRWALQWQRTPSWLRSTLILFGIWSVPVLIGSSGHFLGMAAQGMQLQMPAYHIWGHSLATWYIWIPTTPVILWLGRRYHFGEGQRLVSLLVHVVAASLMFLLQALSIIYVSTAIGHMTPGVPLGDRLAGEIINQYVFTLLTYAVVVSAAAGLRLARHSRDRERQALQLEAQLAQARLEALRSQLQPHFLFNALNSAVMLVRQGNNPEATSVLVQISDLLRYVLDERTPMVSLRDELHFLHRYLGIEQVRFGDRLVVEASVPDDLLGLPVPNLILQPLVENALRHGVGAKTGVGHLSIRARRNGSGLELEIEDDGPGVEAGWSLERDAGVGLSSTMRRLQELFGAGYKLEISSGTSGGTLARVTVPT